MSGWEAIALGLVQGLTEFLPISSSGHLVMGQALFGLEIPGVVFEIALHVATLASILIVFRERVGAVLRGAVRGEGQAWRYVGLLAVATAPAAAAGLVAGGALEGLFERPAVAGASLLVTGTFLWSSRAALGRSRVTTPGLREAVGMGLAQAAALVPGISRSGATVVAGLWLGLEAREAATFSFLMAVPAVVGAAVLEVLRGGADAAVLGPWALTMGCLVAAASGVLAIHLFVRLLATRRFHTFAPYCWVVGSLFLLFLRFGG